MKRSGLLRPSISVRRRGRSMKNNMRKRGTTRWRSLKKGGVSVKKGLKWSQRRARNCDVSEREGLRKRDGRGRRKRGGIGIFNTEEKCA